MEGPEQRNDIIWLIFSLVACNYHVENCQGQGQKQGTQLVGSMAPRRSHGGVGKVLGGLRNIVRWLLVSCFKPFRILKVEVLNGTTLILF